MLVEYHPNRFTTFRSAIKTPISSLLRPGDLRCPRLLGPFHLMPGLYRTYYTLPRLTSLYHEDNLGALCRILHQRICKNKLFMLQNI